MDFNQTKPTLVPEGRGSENLWDQGRTNQNLSFNFQSCNAGILVKNAFLTQKTTTATGKFRDWADEGFEQPPRTLVKWEYPQTFSVP